MNAAPESHNPTLHVGISGWTYAPWRGNFYPRGLPQRLELAYASRRFNTLEVNGTFYSLQRPMSFALWYDQSPPGFIFALKGGRYITHMRRLKNPLKPTANFFASGPLRLHEKLGPILWQFPPNLPFDADRFRRFFDILPRDTHELAKLARKHDQRLKGRAYLDAGPNRPIRHAVEFRHESFLSADFVNLLRAYNIALVIADVASRFPTAHNVTADFLYIRLHGSRRMYVSGYSPSELDTWAHRISAWHRGRNPRGLNLIKEADGDGSGQIHGRVRNALRPVKGCDVFTYFDNTDVKLRAPVDARNLAKRLGVGPDEPPSVTLGRLGVRPPGKSAAR